MAKKKNFFLKQLKSHVGWDNVEFTCNAVDVFSNVSPKFLSCVKRLPYVTIYVCTIGIVCHLILFIKEGFRKLFWGRCRELDRTSVLCQSCSGAKIWRGFAERILDVTLRYSILTCAQDLRFSYGVLHFNNCLEIYLFFLFIYVLHPFWC